MITSPKTRALLALFGLGARIATAFPTTSNTDSGLERRDARFEFVGWEGEIDKAKPDPLEECRSILSGDPCDCDADGVMYCPVGVPPDPEDDPETGEISLPEDEGDDTLKKRELSLVRREEINEMVKYPLWAALNLVTLEALKGTKNYMVSKMIRENGKQVKGKYIVGLSGKLFNDVVIRGRQFWGYNGNHGADFKGDSWKFYLDWDEPRGFHVNVVIGDNNETNMKIALVLDGQSTKEVKDQMLEAAKGRMLHLNELVQWVWNKAGQTGYATGLNMAQVIDKLCEEFSKYMALPETEIAKTIEDGTKVG
ncbi:MAG: hypothetical protein M1837_000372 [Sclerophora amabilis]|nr:MAG: hypothetical protein M1837_000372 [Sclerophora amabilis]